MVMIFLPETLGHTLKETIEDIEGKPQENETKKEDTSENEDVELINN